MSIWLKKTPPKPANDGTESGAVGAVSVDAVTLYSVLLKGVTTASSATSDFGTSIVILPFGPVAALHAPGAVGWVVPGYVRATPPPITSVAFSPTQHWILPPQTDSAYTIGFLPPFWHVAMLVEQPGLAGTSHWVCQISTSSVSGAAGG